MRTPFKGGLVSQCPFIRTGWIVSLLLALMAATSAAAGGFPRMPSVGHASWYGEQHRGLLMANGKKFNPDKLTAASWFYPLGTRVSVTTRGRAGTARSVIVTITDRGPADRLVAGGRIIDLSQAAFKRLAQPSQGLVNVQVQPLPKY